MMAAAMHAQTADEIAAKAVEAMGGADKFASIETFRGHGRMRIGPGPFTPIAVVARRPDFLRMEVTVGADLVAQAYDGAIGWQSISGDHKQEPTALTGESLAHQ